MKKSNYAQIMELADEGSFKLAPFQFHDDGIIQNWEFSINGGRVKCISSIRNVGLFAFEVGLADLAQIAGKTVEGEE